MPRAFRVMPRTLNPAVRHLAPYLPPLAVLHHRGRRSGRQYDTPVQAYRTPQGYLTGYAYSANPGWAQNLLSAGEGEMTRRGKQYRITSPHRLDDDGLALLPKPVATLMRGIGVTSFLLFDAQPRP